MRLTLIILFLLLPLVHGARVHGTVYDFDLDSAVNAVISIDTVPRQHFVTKDGTYSFALTQGNYTISARLRAGSDRYTAYENITIVDSRDYIVDILLYPDLSDQNELLDADLTAEEPYPESGSLPWAALIIVAVVLGIGFLLLRRPKPTSDDLADEVLAFIKSEGGRVKQKDIRRKFPLSEAKISLIVSQLAHEGKVKKIKKGRSNIVVLQE